MLDCAYLEQNVLENFIYMFSLRESIKPVDILVKIEEKLKKFDGHWPDEYESSIRFLHQYGRNELIFFRLRTEETPDGELFRIAELLPSAYYCPQYEVPFVFYREKIEPEGQ